MTEYYDKYSMHQLLVQPVKLFGQPKTRDKIDILNTLRPHADLSDIEYIYPLVFDKNSELASCAAKIVAAIMRNVQGKQWNRVYDQVKCIRIDLDSLTMLPNFDPEVTVHLLGVASLNWSGYIREKAIKLISEVKSSCAVPYILLRLNDWVIPVRNLAEYSLKQSLAADNIEAFISHSYLINKLQNVIRVDLMNTRQDIVTYLKDDMLKDKLKNYLKHPHVKTRLFCYMILADRIAVEDDIIDSAVKDKSYEIRMCLIEAIKTLECEKRDIAIGKLLHDRSAKVKVALLRNFEDVFVQKFKERLNELIYDECASVRDEARFISKKYSFVTDFPEFYRQQILTGPLPGALVGLGETGSKNDFSIIREFCLHEDVKIRLAAIIGLWYLSKEDAVSFVLEALDSKVPKIKKTAKQFLKKSQLPSVLFEMKKRLQDSYDDDVKLFALDVVYRYGGWQALDGILFAIVNEQGSVQEKAKSLLNFWISASSRLYSKPDGVVRNNILNRMSAIRNRNIISESSLKEVSFVIETRSL